MKNICITKSNDKFNKNLPYYTEYFKIYEIDVNSSIYKSYYSLNQNIDIFIFNASKITNEIISFANEFSDQKRFVIYLDTDANIDNLKQINRCNYLIKSNLNLDIEGLQIPSNLINETIYSDIDHSIVKKNQAIYFLDNEKSIPSNLTSRLLYPKTKIPIKMFNGDNINHYQNLGHLTEHSRKNILLESKILIYNNHEYINEAKICGCQTISLEKAETCSSIEELMDNSEPKDNQAYESYGQFIKDFIL